MSDDVPTLDAATELLSTTIPMLRRLGIRVVALRPGFVKLSAPLLGNENHVGTMYAGVLFTLAEIPGGVLIMSMADLTRFFPIVTDMHVRFLRPGTGDVTVEASLDPDEVERLQEIAERDGKAAYVLELEVKDQAGTVVMSSEAHYQLRARRSR